MDEELFNRHGTNKYASGYIFSNTIRAGRRTYFIDAKDSGKNGLYMSITESRKRTDKAGQSYFEKHKIFVYQADLKKFLEGLLKVIEFIENYDAEASADDADFNRAELKEYTDVKFEDLESTEVTDKNKNSIK